MNHDTPGTECAASPLRRVLILGCGVIGGNVLDLLSRLMPWLEITIACRTEARLLERVNLAAAVAMNVVGTCPRLSYRVLDLADVSRTSDLIDELKPQVVINATSLQTFWEISTLPKDAYLALNEARIGPWIPNHLALAWKLMRAVKATSQHPFVINTAFPDSVNPVLAQAGLAPSVGAGNLANAVPTLRRAAAKLLDTDPDRVEVRFVAHHYVGNRIATYGDPGGAPFHLSILADGAEVTGCLDTSSLFRLFVSALRRQRGVPGQVMAASSVVAVLRAMTCSSRVSVPRSATTK